MITDEKIQEVKKKIKNGVPAGEIREEMLRDGYSENDIEKCFEVKKIDMRSWFLFSALFFFIAGLWILSTPPDTVFYGSHWKAFSIATGLLLGYWWPEQKNKENEQKK